MLCFEIGTRLVLGGALIGFALLANETPQCLSKN